jgi:hypothetical protein
VRRSHHTILLVCEGYADDELARVIRDIYLSRNCGINLSRKNARGNSGARALRLAQQFKHHTPQYDEYAVLVDTDADWGDSERARARSAGIICVENAPCLEATLLIVDGQSTHRDSHDNKRVFKELYGGPAHQKGVIQRNFTKAKFDSTRSRVGAIDSLLRLLRC